MLNEEACWAALVLRDQAADCSFVYGVKTTKIYCRPICKARLARRSNITFYDTPAEAEHAGFRACKRCKPDLQSRMPEEDADRKVGAFIDQAASCDSWANVEQMAKSIGLSKWHFHRTFKKITGQTPSEYFQTLRSTGSIQTTPSLTSDNTGSSLDDISPGPIPFIFEDLLSGDYSTWDFDISNQAASSSTDTPMQDRQVKEKLRVYYSVCDLTVGKLLIAYVDYRVKVVQLGSSTDELIAAMERMLPSWSYDHYVINADDAGTAALRDHTDMISAAIDCGPLKF